MLGDDAELTAAVLAAQDGDETAFRTVYRAVHPRLLGYVRTLVGDPDAEDVTSEAWLQIARDLERFSGDADRFRGWAARIARNRALDHIRMRGRRPAIGGDETELTGKPGEADTAGEAIESLATDRTLSLIAQLPQDQAEAVVLRVVVGLDAKSAADTLGKRPGAVRTAAHRGLKRLAELLGADDPESPGGLDGLPRRGTRKETRSGPPKTPTKRAAHPRGDVRRCDASAFADAEGHVMADEQYRWLDRDAAERLLRGESLEAVDADTRKQAEQLAEALGALAADPLPNSAELPGEAAALAAFRTARQGRNGEEKVLGGRGRPHAVARAAHSADAGLVRLGRPERAARRGRLGRPVRLGVAAALAAGMIGGVAAAAGTGVLPTPFGGDEPGPTASVSAAVTPERPLGSSSPGAIGDGGGSEAPTPDGTSGAPVQGGSSHDEADKGSAASGRPGADSSRNPARSREWWSAVLSSCRDVRGGKDVGTERMRSLEEAAGGGLRVHKYCKGVLAYAEGHSGSGSGAIDPGDDEGSGRDSGSGRGDRDGKGDGDGTGDGDNGGRGGDGDGHHILPGGSAPAATA